MAQLVLTYQNLYDRVSHFLGLTAEGTSPTGNDLTKCQDIVARAYRQFLYPIDSRTGELHDWSFLKQLYIFNTQSGKWKYSLPKLFSDIIENPHFDDTKAYNELTKITPGQILELRSASVSSGFPTYFAIAPFTYDQDTGTYYEMWLDPQPDGVYLLKFWYRIDPLKPSATTDSLVGGVKATEAILESCLAVAEQQEDNTIGIHTQLAESLIQKLIRSDVIEDSDYLGSLNQKKPFGYRWYLPVDTSIIYEDEGGITG